MLEFHARCTENGTHRSRCSTLFPNYFSNVARRDAQSNDSRFAFGDGFDHDAVCVIDQCERDLRHKVCHIFYRVFPCRRLGCLSHHTPSDFGSHDETLKPSLRLVSCEIFRKVLVRAEHRRWQSRVQPGPSANASSILTLQYQGVYVKRCAGRPAENLVRQQSLGTT
jgi:hypothetical protein